MMQKNLVRSALLAVAMAGAAFADSVTLTITGPGIGVAGTSVTLFASVTNISGSELSLDGLGFTLVSPFADPDPSPFYSNWPLSLDADGPGSQFGPAAIFEIAIPLGTATGAYSGNVVNLFGGGDSANLLGSQFFEIEVVTAAVPEPSTACLILSAMASIAAVRLRKRCLARK